MFDQIQDFIEIVDVKYNNVRDHSKVIFRCKDDPTKVIKWCRRNFGDRGDGWDFAGAGKNVDIIIWSSKLITMYELWQN